MNNISPSLDLLHPIFLSSHHNVSPIIIPIQFILPIQLLTIILIWLHIITSIRHQTTKRIVIIHFIDFTGFVSNYTDISLMIFNVKVELVILETIITRLIQQHLQTAVLIDRIATINGRSRIIVYYMRGTDFPAVCRIFIFNTTSVSKLM